VPHQAAATFGKLTILKRKRDAAEPLRGTADRYSFFIIDLNLRFLAIIGNLFHMS
jgi:hypothetical protein